MKLISLGTALRNPTRLSSFLSVLNQFSGRYWNNTTQELFFRKLIELRFYGYQNHEFYNNLTPYYIQLIDNPNYVLTQHDIDNILALKNYTGGPSLRGRTAAKPLEKLGYASFHPTISINNNIQPLAAALISWIENDPLSGHFIKPFIAAIHLFTQLNNHIYQFQGLSSYEFNLFLTTFTDGRKIHDKFQEIVSFKNNQINPYFILSNFENNQNYEDYGNNLLQFYLNTDFFVCHNQFINLNFQRQSEINQILLLSPTP